MALTTDRVYIGIDPGATGAIALVTESKQYAVGLPYYAPAQEGARKIVRQIDSITLSTFFYGLKGMYQGAQIFVGIEKNNASPGMGTVSAFNYGFNFGKLLALCEINFESIELITPSVWKNSLGLTASSLSKKEKKELSAVRALELFPKLESSLYTKRGALLDGHADALLIAAYLRRLKDGLM